MGKYIRKSPEEVLAAKRYAASKIKNHNGGRPKGSKNKITTANGCTLDEPRTQMQILKRSRDILAACAKAEGVSMLVFMKRLCDQLKLHPKYAVVFGQCEQNGG